MTKYTFARAAAIAALFLGAISANAATISLEPSASSVTVGSTFTLDVIARDINLGGFDLSLKFKPLLSPYVSAQFGGALGDPDALTFYGVTDNIDALAISQVSFADAPTLAALQGTAPGNQYKLLTLKFTAATAGVATFEIDPTTVQLTDYNGAPLSADFNPAKVIMGDPTGDPGSATPEPATWLLSATAGAALFLARRYRRR